MKQSKKLFFLLRSHWPIFVIAFGLIIFPSFAHAGWLGDAILYGFGLLLKGIAYVIGLIGGIFISLGGLIIQYALELNTKILESPVVNAGFNISLSVANLGFVAVLLGEMFGYLIDPVLMLQASVPSWQQGNVLR